jgi:preprotein translocase SecE subunit
MKKISWPGKKQIINNTGVVIAVVVAASIVVGGFDYLLNLLIGLFLAQ